MPEPTIVQQSGLLSSAPKMVRIEFSGKLYDVNVWRETDEEMACRAVRMACCDGNNSMTLERIMRFKVRRVK